MNERILELIRLADVHILPDDSEYGHCIIGLEKFAELIVRECADICVEMAAKCAGLPGDGALAKDCAHWIKQDFGVE